MREEALPAFADSVADVPYQVRTELTVARTLAAVRAVTTPQRLSTDIIRLLDQVWPLYGDCDDDPARRRTDVYFQLEPAPR